MTQIILVIVILFGYFTQFSRDKNKIVESLKSLSPLFLEIIFVLLILLIVISFKDIIAPFKEIKKKNWIFVGVILLFAFILAFFVAPKTHRIYYDESIYLHIGQSIAYTKKAQMINYGEMKYGELIVNQGEYNKQPNGYPYFLSVFYRIFGNSENLSFLLSNFIYLLATMVVFLIAYLLSRNFKIGIYASLVFAVIPQNILWHNSTSVEPANAFFLSLTILLFLIYLNSEKTHLLFLTGISACFASQFRMESILIFPLLIIIMLIKKPKLLKEQKIYYLIPLILLLMLPHFLHINHFQDNQWGASQEQAKYSFSFLKHNLETNGLFFLNNKDFPALLTIFLFVGLISKSFIREKIKILIWLLFFWGVFLFFYAGSYYYGADIRFALMAFPPLSILAGFGFSQFDDFIKKHFKKGDLLALVLILTAFVTFLPKSRTVGQEAWAARADHHYAKIMSDQLDSNSIIFTHNPNMFLFWGKSAAQASILAGYDENGLQNLRNNFPGGIYFHFNFWCNVSDPLQQSFCKNILDKFPHTEVLKFQERDYKYILYKMSLRGTK